MTEPYARPADEAGDDTIPLVPDAGYAPTEQFPFAEETLLDQSGTSPWSADAPGSFPAPGYGGAPGGSGTQPPAPPENYAQPQPGHPQPQPAQPGYSPHQAPQTNYVQPQPGHPQPQPAQPGYSPHQAPQTNYVQPQAAPAAGYPSRPEQTGYAEPTGPADGIGAQNFYQGYPTAGYPPQQPAWPAVIQDPVGYDYGYGRQPAVSDHPNATISLVLGLIGLFFFQLLSPVAWYLAAKGKREMAAAPGRWRNSGTLTAGLVLGIIGTALMSLVVFGVLMFVVLIAGSGG